MSASPTALPLVPALRPAWTATIGRKAVLAVAGSLALAVSAQVQIPLWPVPVTGQTLVVLLLGFAFGPRLAVATVATYLAEGLVGLPVFAGGAAGAAVLAGPTAGYLWGFLAAAGLTGWLAERGWHRRAGTVVAGMLLGNVVIYVFGAGWLARMTGLAGAWEAGVLPFLVGDALKIAAAVALLPRLSRVARRD